MANTARDVESIERIRKSVATVPWERLAHAYAGASDAPSHLDVFLSSTTPSAALDQSIEWMWASILHQGSVYSASTPVMWILVDLLAAWPQHPAAASILRGVQTVADAIPLFDGDYDDTCGRPVQSNKEDEPSYESWVRDPLPANGDGEIGEEYFRAAVVTKRGLLTLVHRALPVIRAALAHPDKATRIAAVGAGLGALRSNPPAVSSLDGLKDLEAVIDNPDFDPGTWVSAAMVLGELGRDHSRLLEHPDRRARLAGAMSPATRDDPRAVAELAVALAEPEWLERAFPNGLAHMDMHARFHVLAVLLRRTNPGEANDAVIEAFCTVIRTRSDKYTADMEWGPILRWAFPERIVTLPHTGALAPLPRTLTRPQAAILRALCERGVLWDPRSGNAILAFKRVQLPFDRKTLRRLANGSTRARLLDFFRRN